VQIILIILQKSEDGHTILSCETPQLIIFVSFCGD